MTYLCDIAYETFTLEDQASPTEVTFTAPDRATKDTVFSVTMDITPGMGNGPALPAGSINSVYSEILVGAGGTPEVLTKDHGPHPDEVAGFTAIPIPRHTGDVTASGEIGGMISFAPGQVVVKTDAYEGASAGTVTCDPPSDAIIETRIVEEELTQQGDPPPPPPTPAASDPTTTDGSGSDSGDTTTPTTAAPVPAGPQAQVIEQSAQVEFVCNISLGKSSVPPQDDPQTVTIKTVDKVAPGGKLDFQVRLDPGPSTGPIALPEGIKDMRIGVVAGGAASPGEVEVVVGDIPSRVETNSHIRVPAASGSVTASGSDGEQVTLTVNRMSFRTEKPQNSTTNCTAANAPVITTTQIVEGVEVAAETEQQLAVTGSDNSLLVSLALVQLVLGLGLVTFSAARRRNRSSWGYVRR